MLGNGSGSSDSKDLRLRVMEGGEGSIAGIGKRLVSVKV